MRLHCCLDVYALELLAGQHGPEEARIYCAMYCQYIFNTNGEVPIEDCIEAVNRDGLEANDLRFSALWIDIAIRLVDGPLPNKNFDLTAFHAGIIEVVNNLEKLGQDPKLVQRGQAARDIIHIYHASQKMIDAGMPQFATKLLLGLPRYAQWMMADKAYFDAGLAAKEAGDEATALILFNRFLDICERIEDEDGETSGEPYDNQPFQSTDFPTNYRLPTNHKSSISKERSDPINNWVLQASIGIDTSDLSLAMVEIPGTGEKMYAGSLQSPSGVTFEPCAITSYPILNPKQAVKCRSCARPANQEDWNKYCMVVKYCPWCSQPAQPDFKM